MVADSKQDEAQSQHGDQPRILNLSVPDKKSLYAAYMPFITNGGVFVPTPPGERREYRIGDEVFLLLNLSEQEERLPIAGKVVWITPPGAQGQRTQGVGVQFSNRDGGAAQQKIETILAGMLESERPTKTL